MKNKFLCLALALSGSWLGCSTNRTRVLDYSAGNSISADDGVLKGLGNGYAIQVAANSWPALVLKAKPAFAWNGRDLLWIRQGPRGEPAFMLDEAYIYQPTNQSRQWILVNKEERAGENFADWSEYGWWQFGNQYLRAVILLQAQKPEPHDGDVSGDYAVVKSVNRQHGVVYEIGWQSETSSGVAHPEFGRRIYLFKDPGNRWHFVGEGPEECKERGLECIVASRVEWNDAYTNEFPFQIKFHQVAWDWTNVHEDDYADHPPDRVTTNNYVLAGQFPAQIHEENLP